MPAREEVPDVRALLALLAAAFLSGCFDPGVVPFLRTLSADASDWELDVEPSMAPDFRGDGESYPVLLVHQHHIPSPRQQEEARRNPVVCATTDGAPIPLLGAATPTADMAACMGPQVDVPTGRIFADAAPLRSARALVVMTGACTGGYFPLDDAQREFLVRTPKHDFLVRLLDNGTFTVDGRWVERGTALKIGYYIHKGTAQDEEYVRVVFDAPGEWLWSRVRPQGPDVDADVPPRPTQGDGLVVDVDLAPASLRAPVMAAANATPNGVTSLLGLRAVHDDERLTELTIRFDTPTGPVTWYGAGRTQGALRLLGAEAPAFNEAGVDMMEALDAFDMTWATLRAGNAARTTDVRLATQSAWSAPAELPLGLAADADPVGCDGGCVLVKSDAGWQRVLLAQERNATAALTLHVLAIGDGEPAHVWWHVAS